MIDEPLQRALDIEPSPEFVSRVRQRIATEPSPRSWPVRPVGVVFACLVVVLALAFVAREFEILDQPATLPPPLQTHQIPGAARAFDVDTSSARMGSRSSVPLDPKSSGANAPRAIRVGQPAAANSGNPAHTAERNQLGAEVLISGSESRAIRDLIAGVRGGRIDSTSLPLDQLVVTEVTVPEMVVDPIIVDPILKGER
jgi:hypothetical protein